MDEETQKIIEEQMKILPKDVVAAIISVDYKTKLQEITRRQKLLIDQAGKLEMETTLVMIGLEPLADYINNLQRELELSNPRAKEIALDVSENIFKPIRESLQAMNEGIETEPIENTTKFTNSNEADLNRDQILKEIENPEQISGGSRTMDFKKPEIIPTKTTKIEIRPSQEVKTVPGEEVKDITKDIMTSKMTGTTIISQEIVEAKPETKLPEVKQRPSSGVDPYREPIS